MLRKLFGSRTRAPAPAPPAVELVPLADLPPEAELAVAGALQAANALAGSDPAAAAEAIAQACAEHPGDALAHALHGLFLARAGAPAAAQAAYDTARRLEAGQPLERTLGHHFFARGVQHLNAEDPDRADACLEIAEGLLTGFAAPAEMRGLAGYLSGDTRAGHAHFVRALSLAGASERGALEVNRLIDTLPQVGMTAAELAAARERFEAELDRLLETPPTIPDPLRAIHRTAFFLCYQGRNDRSANERLARLFLRASPGLDHRPPWLGTPAPPGRRKLTVGVVSAYLGRHSVGVWYRDLVRLLIETDRFETVLFAYGGGVDPRLQAAASARGAFVALGRTLAEARTLIEARRPDVLLYTDVGMHPFTYFLAFSRLAPIQALLVGHPCTSGIASIDYFVSNAYQDSGEAQAHYSEQLVRLPGIGVYVARTDPPPARVSRSALGWEQRARYYVCPMMLQKLHPDFDAALAGILRRDPLGRVVLFADAKRPLWQHQLEQRFAATMPDVAARIAFRPFAPKDEFLGILLAADCVLDPFHFSGGVTSYVALGLGVPLVTLPGELLRSRMTAGMYAQAGVTDCVARSPDHFVELALAYAADPALRAGLRARLADAAPLLFETRRAVDELADWVETVASRRA